MSEPSAILHVDTKMTEEELAELQERWKAAWEKGGWSKLQVLPESPQCPATMRHIRRYTVEATGVQCKYLRGHDGDHAGYAGPSEGDVFWPQDEPAEGQPT